MALSQEQQNIDLAVKQIGADVKAINAAIATKATLIGGKLDPAQVPDLAIVQFLGTVASQSAMLALTGQIGDWTIRSDDGKVYIITAGTGSAIGNWQALSYPVAQAPDNYSYVGAYNTAKS